MFLGLRGGWGWEDRKNMTWFGYVERMNDERLLSEMYREMEGEGRWSEGLVNKY